MDNLSNFSDRLNQAMKLRKLSAYKLSKEIQLGQSVISEYKKGRVMPKLGTIKLIASILEVSEEWLLDGIGSLEIKNENKFSESENTVTNDFLKEKVKFLEDKLNFYHEKFVLQEDKIMKALAIIEKKIDESNSINKAIHDEVENYIDYLDLKENLEKAKNLKSERTKS